MKLTISIINTSISLYLHGISNNQGFCEREIRRRLAMGDLQWGIKDNLER